MITFTVNKKKMVTKRKSFCFFEVGGPTLIIFIKSKKRIVKYRGRIYNKESNQEC